MVVELGAIPFTYLTLAAIVALLSLTLPSRKMVVDVVAITGTLIGLLLTIRLFIYVNRGGVALYRFGGFPPPLGVVYVADEVSSTLALLASFATAVSTLYSLWTVEHGVRHLYYILSLLLITGVCGCLFTGDIFNFYVSIELTAISSYALTGVYRERARAVRAAIVYGVAGTIVTSFLLLAIIMLYSSYGTLNMADISLKASNPDIEVPFSGRVYGDVVSVSKVSLALITWVLLFKSGIMPNHFWLPEAYRAAPLPAIALFTASADIIGVYGLIRFYYTVFGEEVAVGDFRILLLNLLMAIGCVSTIVSALLVSRQRSLRGLVAYSSISQFSLALLGVAARVSESIAGAILHLVANGLGDTAVIFGAAAISRMGRGGCGSRAATVLSYAALVIGLLNLFGVLPILPGFWSKTYLTMGFIRAGLPQGAAIVLISTGLCAVGYLRTIIRLLSLPRTPHYSSERKSIRELIIALATLVIVVATIVGLGIILTASSTVRNILIRYGASVVDSKRYIEKILQ